MLINKDNIDMQKLFFKILIFVFILRSVLAAWIPITGDEAYFIVWGKHFDYGYYDHTPFVGWLLAAFLTVSDATWWLRLPSILLPLFISYFIYRILKTRNPDVAVWVALVYLVAPVNIVNFLITTDTSLIFFSFVSAWYFYKALYFNKTSPSADKISYQDFLLSGLFLGLAFFSKYFAVILGVVYGVYILVYHRNRKGMVGLGLVLLMVLPFAFINLLWNYNHCWNNILFNLFNRTADGDNAISSLTKYIAMLVYLFSPVLLFYLFKNRDIFKQQYTDDFNRVYIWLAVLPLLLFLFLLLKKEVGLHWVFSFYPFLFIAVAGVLNNKQWRWTFHFMWVLSLLHILALASLMVLPVETFSSKKEAVQNLVFGKYPTEVLAKLKPYEKDYTFATISYGMSSVASYHSKKHFIVFSKGSYHAREDDRLTDYKKLDGKNILIFKRTTLFIDDLAKYFKTSQRKTIKVRGATFELLVGNGFKYDLYYEQELKKINHDFYSIPDWLPVGQCEFKEKYQFK